MFSSYSYQKQRRFGRMGSCWRFSTLKSIRVIAFMDLIDAIIFMVYRGVLLTLLLAKIPTSKNDREMTGTGVRTPSGIGGGGGSAFTPAGTKGTNQSFIGSSHRQHQHTPPHHTGLKNPVDDESHSLEATYMRYYAVIVLTGIVLAFAVEIFLFLLLNSGAPLRNLRHCKHWFFLRVLLLLFSIAGSAIDIYMGSYSLISGLLEVEKVYRVGTLLIMLKFMEEVKAGDFDTKLNCGGNDGGGSSNVFGSYSQAP